MPFELVARPDDGSDVITLTSGKIVTGFKENRCYTIELPSSGHTLVIDDQEFRSDDGTVRWTPGFFAGTVAAELLGLNGRTVESYTLDVSAHPGKLGSEVFRSMLEDLWQFDPALVIGTEPSTSNVGITGAYESDWLTYARLRRYADDYLTALARIAVHPLRELRTRREHVPLTRVRRADRLTGLSIQRQPVLAAVREEDVGVSVAALRLDVPVTEETLDSAANRLMAWQARAIAWRVERLMEDLEPKPQSGLESGTRMALADRWPRRREFLNDIGTRLDRLRRRSVLREVTRPAMTVAGLNAVSADPAYGRAWRLGWCILRRGIEGDLADERLWISPTWEIYERWCFVRVKQWLTDTHEVEWSPRVEKNVSDSRILKGHDRNGRRFDLHLQPTFLAWDVQRGQSSRRSISGQRIPDILLEIDNGSRNVVLDAKYRTTRANVLDAMASAHIYRDALRIAGNRIDSALLLVPRSEDAPWLQGPTFIREHSVGVVELSPSSDSDGLTSVIGNLVAGA